MRAKFITDKELIKEIILKCDICNMSMVDENNMPYVVPMNFGYDNETIYFHSHPEGKKMNILEKNPAVSVSFSTDHELYNQSETVACSYGMAYKSVFASGDIEFIDDYDEKVFALNMIMAQYVAGEFSYNRPSVINVRVFKLKPGQITCKLFGKI